MPKDARLAVPRLRWIGAAGLVAVVVLAGLAWFLIKDSGKAAQSAATAPPPSPAVGVRPVVTKGVSQSFEFVGRIKATDKVELRARVEGFLEKVLFKRGPGRQDGRPALPDREGAVRGGGRTGQGKSRCCRSRGDQRQAAIRPQSRTVEATSSVRRARSTRTRRRSTPPRAKVLQTAGGAEAGPGQSRLHRHPRADRRPHRPHRLHRRQSRQPGERRAGDDRQPGPDLCACSRSACASSRRSARRGARRAAGSPRSRSACACSNGQEYPHRGVWNLTDPQVDQQTDTLIMRATIPNPERTADRRPVRHRGDPRAAGGAAPGGAAGGAADRPVRLLRAGRRRRAQGRAAPRPDRAEPGHRHRRHLRPARGRATSSSTASRRCGPARSSRTTALRAGGRRP